MKNLIITILCVFGVIYLFGALSESWLIMHLDDIEIIDPLVSLLVFCCVAGGLILLGFLLTVSLLGALLLGLGGAVLAVIFVGIHFFWPLLFVALIIYLVAGDKKQTV